MPSLFEAGTIVSESFLEAGTIVSSGLDAFEGGTRVSPARKLSAELLTAADVPICVG